MAMISTTQFARPTYGFGAALKFVFGLVAANRQQLHLADLDSDQLFDIGLTRREARRLSHRPVWTAARHWMR